MAGVLKAGSAARSIRDLGAGAVPPIPVVDAMAEQRAEIARLTDEIRALRDATRRAAAEAEARRKADCEAARAEGRRAGSAAAQDRADERLAVLRAGIAAQTAEWQRQFAAIDMRAATLATAALERLFVPTPAMREMVAASLLRNAARLRDEGVLSITVSAADFADGGALDAAVAAMGRNVTVTIDAGLAAGACHATVRLGAIDLGVRDQWARLAMVLAAEEIA